MNITVPNYATIWLDSADAPLRVTGSEFASGQHTRTIRIISVIVTPSHAEFWGWKIKKDGTEGLQKARVVIPTKSTYLAEAAGSALTAQIRRLARLTEAHVAEAEKTVVA
jgi:hypothetical protein